MIYNSTNVELWIQIPEYKQQLAKSLIRESQKKAGASTLKVKEDQQYHKIRKLSHEQTKK